MPETLLIARKCPNCGAPLGEGSICAYCSIRSERVSAANKPRVSVAGENQDLQFGEITFNKRVGFDDEQLEGIAGQVAAAMAAGPEEPRRDYLGFSLPLPPTSGRPPALFVEAHRIDDGGFKVLFVSDYIPQLHADLREKSRMLNFPLKII